MEKTIRELGLGNGVGLNIITLDDSNKRTVIYSGVCASEQMLGLIPDQVIELHNGGMYDIIVRV